MLWSHHAARAKTPPFLAEYHSVMWLGLPAVPRERSALLIIASTPAITATPPLWARRRSRRGQRDRTPPRGGGLPRLPSCRHGGCRSRGSAGTGVPEWRLRVRPPADRFRSRLLLCRLR